MNPSFQCTIANTVSCRGIALHSGARAFIKIMPAPPDSGITFYRTDMPGSGPVAAIAGNVFDSSLATTISNGNARISTIEHLMAALHGLGIDNALIELNGLELPVLDGSADSYVHLIDAAGIVEQHKPRRFINILRPVEVADGDRYAALLPSERFEMSVEIDFTSDVIGQQRFESTISSQVFINELSRARTFGFMDEVNALKRAGLARGGSLDNAIVIGSFDVLNREGLRYPDEFVRHKALDALGDLYLIGHPIIGRFESYKSGHFMNWKLVSEVLSDPRNYELVEYRKATVSPHNRTIGQQADSITWS